MSQPIEHIRWTNQRWSVSDLKDWPKNPRKLNAKGIEDLKRSIQSIGYASPLEINLDGTIIGGHARKKVLLDLGFEEIDVRVPERLLTEAELAEANVRLNKNVAGVFDMDILANEFDIGDLGEWGFDDDSLGISEDPEEKKGRRPWSFLVNPEERETIRTALDKAPGKYLGEKLAGICAKAG